VGLLVIFRRWRTALLGGSLLMIAAWPFFQFPPDIRSPGRKTAIRVVTLNVWARNTDYTRVVEFIRKESPDIVVLEEIDEQWRDPLDALQSQWPHREMVLEGGHHGIALLSRLPFDRSQIDSIDGDIPMIIARVSVNDMPVTLCGVHLTRPTSSLGAERQARQLDDLVELLNGEPPARVVLGDFNATPWTATFSGFLSRSGLRDSRSSFGNQASWPAFLPGILRIPIDHCLVSPDVRVVHRKLGPNVGSDHLAVVIDLEIVPTAGMAGE
jgi:endonuclease/exonuclease/phosphatase (EEP) superfamily protein YafD